MTGPARGAVIGIGNDYRHDDGIGLEVARMVRRAGPTGARVVVGVADDCALLDAWQDCERAWVVDCTRAGAAAGTIRRFDACREPIPAEIFHCFSTHTLNIAKTVELSRVLGTLPATLVVYGVEGADFSHGRGLTPEVRAAATDIVGRIVRSCGSTD
jgi:hydrogenase maturation protease